MSFLDTLLGRKHPPMIGLDISSSSVKLVELGQNGSGEYVLERERLTAAMAAKTSRFYDLLRASDHADEFLDENHRLCGDISTTFAAKHARLLGRMIATAAAAREIALAPIGASATQVAELLLDTAEGIKTRHRTILSADAYRRRLGDAVRILLAGLAPAVTKRRTTH